MKVKELLAYVRDNKLDPEADVILAYQPKRTTKRTVDTGEARLLGVRKTKGVTETIDGDRLVILYEPKP